MTQADSQELSLDDLLDNISDLPTLPTVVTKINQMASNPQTNASDIGELIANDPSLSSKILKLVNSAYYGFPRKINSVTKAIVLLGFNKVKNIAISASVVEIFKKASGTIGFDFTEFWCNSIATAIASETVAKKKRPDVADDAFVAGLLHDLGKIIFSAHVPTANQAFEKARADKSLFRTACQATFSCDQAKVGALLGEMWNFPDNLTKAIRYWPYPDRTRQFREIIDCVHIAHVMVSALGLPGAGDFAMPQMSENVWEDFKLDEATLEELMTETINGYDNASAFIELANQ